MNKPKKTFNRIIVHGGNHRDQHELRLLLSRLPATLSTETEQMTKVQAQDDALSIFLFKPAQTGFSAVAEMTANAIQNPDNTAIIMTADADETEAERVDREALQDVLGKTNATVFTDYDTAIQAINEMAAVVE